jgi:hypothetical protein
VVPASAKEYNITFNVATGDTTEIDDVPEKTTTSSSSSSKSSSSGRSGYYYATTKATNESNESEIIYEDDEDTFTPTVKDPSLNDPSLVVTTTPELQETESTSIFSLLIKGAIVFMAILVILILGYVGFSFFKGMKDPKNEFFEEDDKY